MKRKKLHVVRVQLMRNAGTRRMWGCYVNGALVDWYWLKRDAVKAARSRAKALKPGASLRICGRDGRVKEERTYPRALDPRRSRG